MYGKTCGRDSVLVTVIIKVIFLRVSVRVSVSIPVSLTERVMTYAFRFSLVS